MNKFRLLFLGLLIFTFACNNSEQNDYEDDNTSNVEVTDNDSYDDELIDEEVENGTHEGVDLYSFILSSEKGWDAIDFVYYFSFMEDGRVFGQGDEGEASMWEGTWTLDGDILIVTTSDDYEVSYQLQADGDFLFIDGYKYEKANW
jgi:hypothetical protein